MISDLSRREVEVLRLMCTGITRTEVAKALYRSPKTIDNHYTRIYRKLGVHSAAQAVVVGYESGFVTPKAATESSNA